MEWVFRIPMRRVSILPSRGCRRCASLFDQWHKQCPRAAPSRTSEADVSEPKRVGAIEVDQDLDHVRSLWRVQRVGWVIMLLLVIGGLLGLFGKGPLAEHQVQTNGLTLDYDRFAR